MSTRKQLVLLALWAVFLAAVVGLVFAMTRPHPPEASRGVLVQDVLNARLGSGPPAARIATDPAHVAVVGTDKVTWWDAAGGEHETPVGDRSGITGMFDTNVFTNYREDTGIPMTTIMLALAPTLLIVLLMVALFWRQGNRGPMRLLRARPKGLAAETPRTLFSDVAGCDEAKLELEEIVGFLRDPGRYLSLGARVPKGVLLVGSPGTGKTLLARAVAGEADCGFLAVSGSEFVEMFVGVGAARVRDLFQQAQKSSPCILFIDEIDAVGRQRGALGANHGQEEREQTLNQLLVEMDGFDQSARVVVIAATNRPDVLDGALLRPGRFDRHVTVDLPDVRGRRAILELHAGNKPLSDDVSLELIARRTPGFTGADLANLINESALLAGRDHADRIAAHHLESAIDRVIAGPERKGRIITERERRIIAYHEMGHALVLATLPNTDPVHKVTVVSRGRALGLTLTLPEDDRVLGTRAQLLDQLAGILGGRAAEELLLGADNITTGAADDFAKATALAQRMVTELGMSPLGVRTLVSQGSVPGRSHSEDMSRLADVEVNRLLDQALNRARTVLARRRHLLGALADRLLEVETVEADEMARIIAGDPARPVRERAGGDAFEGGAATPEWAAVAAMVEMAPARSGASYAMRRMGRALARLLGRPGVAA